MKEGKPLAYFSKALCLRNLPNSSYEKELIALTLSIQCWRPYLLGIVGHTLQYFHIKGV